LPGLDSIRRSDLAAIMVDCVSTSYRVNVPTSDQRLP